MVLPRTQIQQQRHSMKQDASHCQQKEPSLKYLSSSLFRRKTRSPSPRRRSPVKRDRRRSPSRSPRRKPSPGGGSSPPPPLMQLPPKPVEQHVDPDTSGRALPDPVVQDASSTWWAEYLLYILEIVSKDCFCKWTCLVWFSCVICALSLACSETLVEAVKADSVTQVKEQSPEKSHKKEERPKSREREKDSRRDRPRHRSRSHSRSRRRRSRSR